MSSVLEEFFVKIAYKLDKSSMDAALAAQKKAAEESKKIDQGLTQEQVKQYNERAKAALKARGVERAGADAITTEIKRLITADDTAAKRRAMHAAAFKVLGEKTVTVVARISPPTDARRTKQAVVPLRAAGAHSPLRSSRRCS